MSFTPLPKILTDTCLDPASPSPQILELGCGDGPFREVLTGLGIFSWGLDRVGPVGGTVADVVGDALVLPLARGSLDILLVPNLLRHLAQVDPACGFVAGWVELLKPGGSLFIFEDEPRDEPADLANYRNLQDFLSRLMPESRGPLLALREFQDCVSALGSAASWEFGLERNRQTIDAAAVLEFLDRGGPATGDSGRLVAAIARDGLDPGFFWWARGTAVPGGKVA